MNIDDPKTLNVEILKRGLSSEEYDRLIGLYKSNRKRYAISKRQDAWATPLTKDENQFLYDAMNTRESITALAEKHKFQTKKAYSKLINVSLRYLYQNREELV